MKSHAYIVGMLRLPVDGKTPESPSFGLFSESTPTTLGTCITFVALTVEEESYEDASWVATRMMDSDARFIRTAHGSRPAWGVATVEEFHARIKARIETEKVKP